MFFIFVGHRVRAFVSKNDDKNQTRFQRRVYGVYTEVTICIRNNYLIKPNFFISFLCNYNSENDSRKSIGKQILALTLYYY